MNFKFGQLVQESPDIVSAALGVDANNPLVANDLGKALKLAANNNYVLCATGNDIEGIAESINPDTVNSGFSFGSVRKNGRAIVTTAAAQAGSIVPGDEVVSGIPIALGTAGTMQVIKGTGTIFKWRCIAVLSGTGAAGDSILIERT